MRKKGILGYISFLCVMLAWFFSMLFFTGWDARGVTITTLTPLLLVISFVLGILGLIRSKHKKVLPTISVILSVFSGILYLTILAVSDMSGS